MTSFIFAVYIVIVIFCVMSLFGLYNLLSPFVALIPLLNNCRYI